MVTKETGVATDSTAVMGHGCHCPSPAPHRTTASTFLCLQLELRPHQQNVPQEALVTEPPWATGEKIKAQGW